MNVYFNVAGANFCVNFKEKVNVPRMLPSFGPFWLKEKPEGEMMFNVTVGDDLVSMEAEGKCMGDFDAGNFNNVVYQLPDGTYKFLMVTHFPDEQLKDQQNVFCAMQPSADFREVKVSLRGSAALQGFGLNNALMISFAYAGSFHKMVLMHASVTVCDDRGYLFLGKSGTGKSTHTEQWLKYIPGTHRLNDDNPVVRILDDGTVMVYGTPWSGKTPCYRNLGFPVGAFVRLKQDPENIIEKETSVVSFATVLSSCSTMIWDKLTYDKICDTVTEIISKRPSFFLRCRPDEEAAQVCHAAVTK